jgi:hypothetical protein
MQEARQFVAMSHSCSWRTVECGSGWNLEHVPRQRKVPSLSAASEVGRRGRLWHLRWSPPARACRLETRQSRLRGCQQREPLRGSSDRRPRRSKRRASPRPLLRLDRLELIEDSLWAGDSRGACCADAWIESGIVTWHNIIVRMHPFVRYSFSKPRLRLRLGRIGERLRFDQLIFEWENRR